MKLSCVGGDNDFGLTVVGQIPSQTNFSLEFNLKIFNYSIKYISLNVSAFNKYHFSLNNFLSYL